MKISSIKVKFTEKDVLDNIKQYIKIDNFNMESITFGDKINIECTYKKVINIKLKVKIQIDRVSKNILYFKILDINIAKIPILNKIKDFALNNVLKGFKEFGVLINKDIISIDIEAICKAVPFIKFKLTELSILKGAIEVEVKDLVISQENEIIEKAEELIVEKQLEPILKKKDKYTDLKKGVLKKLPNKYTNAAEYAFLAPDILILFGRLIKDKRVPIKNKLVIGSIATYLASPINLSILFIPFVGQISSIALIFYGLSYTMEEIPEQIIIENWQGKDAFVLKLKDVVEILNNMAGGRNIDKLINFSKIKFVKVKK